MRREQRRRIVRRVALGLGLAAFAVFAVLPSAAAKAPEPKSATASVVEIKHATGIDLSTVPKIEKYLRSLGVSTKGLVVQRGARNYAGPNCPGFAWNCTAARGVVVQMAQAGQNKFECSPEDDQVYPTAAPASCFLFQSNTDGKNQATCRESTDANAATLTCDITQSNVNGDNHATIDQNVDQRGGATQTAMVDAFLDQDNVNGSNHAGLTQSISQSTSAVTSGGTQSQDADFGADVFQDTDTGNNFLQQSQALIQDGRASGPSTILQVQNGEHFGSVDQEVGADVVLLGGGVAFLLSDDEGFSKAHVTQTERQTLRGPGLQDQSGPMRCCGTSSQEGSPEQTLFTLHQSSTEKASQFDEGTANQFQSLHGDCDTTGTCSINQFAANEADSLRQHESGTGEQTVDTTCSAPGQCVPFPSD